MFNLTIEAKEIRRKLKEITKIVNGSYEEQNPCPPPVQNSSLNQQISNICLS